METQRSCEDRISEHMTSREETFKELFAKIDSENVVDSELAYEELSEIPLCVEKYTMVRVDISTGGPGDWIEAILDEDGRILNASYHFNDWGDHAERPILPESSLWTAVEYYVEGAGV